MLRNIIESFAKKNKGEDYVLDSNIPLGYLLLYAFDRMKMLIRGATRIGFKKKDGKIFIGKKVSMRCKSRIIIGNGTTIMDFVSMDALSVDGITIGDGCSIGRGTIIRCSGNLHNIGKGFHIGKNSSLADNCFVGATGGVYIGDNVIGGQNIRFHSSNHNFAKMDILIKEQGINAKGIKIGNNCWIGAGVVFCDGVTIGDGCVIGANSVITKSFPGNCVIVGNPAKILKMRHIAEEENEKNQN